MFGSARPIEGAHHLCGTGPYASGVSAEWRAGLRPNWGGAESDDFDADEIGVSGKCLDIDSVSGEDRAPGFGNRDDECIDC